MTTLFPDFDRTTQVPPWGASPGVSRPAWVEGAAWTDGMLKALCDGVKGGRWFSLIDKVFLLRVLRRAFALVKANRGAAGVDRVSIAMYEADLEKNLEGLAEVLRQGTYQPMPVRRVYLPKASGGQRPLGIPAVRDRIVQAALRMVLEPIFENEFAEHSYGFRPGRRADDALLRVMSLIEEGYIHVVDLDFASYFDSIPHAPLMALISRKVADSRVLSLVESFLSAGVMEDGVQQWKPTTGTPQGGVISPLLSNIYLDPLDHLLAGAGIEAVRYADDCVLLCRDEVSARRALQLVREWASSVGLRLHPEKTRVVNATEDAFEFLGYRFDRMERIHPRKSSWQKFKDAVRQKTRRTTGESLECVIGRLKPLLRGWANYFRRCSLWVFRDMDQWIRMRLRSMLRRRKGKEGRGRGSDHQRWPNAYFADRGLPSLEELVVRNLQSARR